MSNVGANSATQIFALKNTGGAPLNTFIITVPAPFVRVTTGVTGSCGTTLAANATCKIGVRFSPTVANPTVANPTVANPTATGNLGIASNASNGPQSVALSGTVNSASVVANPDTATAVANTLTSQTVTVTVRTNDLPTNGLVTAVSAVTKVGATATVTATVNNNAIRFVLTGVGTNGTARHNSKVGTYIVTYTLTAGGVAKTATATLTMTQ
jgi:hypothetical protein